jgi:hypothetical protein
MRKSVLLIFVVIAMILGSCSEHGNDNGNSSSNGGNPVAGSHDIDSSLYGTWKDNNGGNTLTVTFSYSGITWGGSLGSALNIQGATWTARNSNIKYTRSGSTTAVYNYIINSGNLLLSDNYGGTTITLVKEVESPSYSTVATPSASPPGGSYEEEQSVILTTTTSEANIYYTLDGSTPASWSTLYNEPITINQTTTLKAIAIKEGMNNSSILTAYYTITIPLEPAAMPTADIQSGTFVIGPSVSLSTTTDDASIYYTLNGSTPSSTSWNSTLYNGPITINQTTTLKAIAVKTGMADSEVMTETYTIDHSGTNPVTTTPGLYAGIYETAVVTPTDDGKILQNAFNWINNNAVNNGRYLIVLGSDEEQASKDLYSNGIILTLQGDNQERSIQLTGTGPLYRMSSSGSATLVLGNNITLKGVQNNDYPLIFFYTTGAKLIMNSGSKITGNVNTDTASLYSGGGVGIYYGNFELNGGEISENKSISGAGVYIHNGEMTMYNGKVSDNIATSSGGGVSLSIRRTSSGDFSGSGRFTMYDGEISNNTAYSGGGVYIDHYYTFIMKDGNIYNNTVTGSGGGIYYSCSTSSTKQSLIMEGGNIYNNTVTGNGNGGGIYIYFNVGDLQPDNIDDHWKKTGGIITGYDDNSSTGNKVLINGIPTAERGHAVFLRYQHDRQMSSGWYTDVTLYRYIDNDIGSNQHIDSADIDSSPWQFVGGLETQNAIQLAANQWADGNILTSRRTLYYTFTPTTTTQFFIHINFGTLTDLVVHVTDENNSNATVGSDTTLNSSSSSTSRSLTSGHRYYIRVTPTNSSYNGNFRIAISTSNTAPSGGGW